MEAGLDTGPVYVCEATTVMGEDTAVTLHDRLSHIGANLLDQHLNDILSGQITATPQDDALSTYAPIIKKEDGLVDWRKTAVELDRHIRAMTPWPGAYTIWQGNGLKILRARAVDGRLPTGSPGKMINLNGNVVVLTSAGGIQLQEVQLAGKRAMNIADFLRGHPDFIGSELGD
jgi:methionyl-tRNA formyltransferase